MKESPDEQIKKSEDLAIQCFNYSEKGDYEIALEIAMQLEELRYSAAFEIGALAHAALGDLEKAIETLERGVAKAPAVWINWQLLGNYRSDEGDYEKANEAYEHALECPDVWLDSIRLNQAILANRRGDHEGALKRLDMIHDPDLSLQVTLAKINALWDMGKVDDALSLADDCLEKEWEGDKAKDYLGYIAAARGRIQLEKGISLFDVRRNIMDAIEAYGDLPYLLALVRDIDGRYSADSLYFRLLVDARLSKEHPMYDEVKGYIISYDVVAETEDEALAYVAEFEDYGASQVDLVIEDSEVLAKRPEDPMGVYRRTGRDYYVAENGD